MEAACRVTVVVLGTLAFIHLVQAQDQQGFISLDCGLSAEELSSPYDEPSTGLRFSSDAAYIQSGLTGSIQPNRESQYLKPYRTLRYFPNGSRNCYNLNVEKGSKYLVRAFFVYENYDGLNIKPKFDLYLGPKLWSTVEWQERDDICLVKNGTTIPLISTLEIRPVGNTIYETVSGSLNLYFRTFFNKSDTYIRYPSDRYDRVWTWYFRNEWTQISTTLQVEVNNLENDYDPPNAALTSAAIPTNSNLPLMINWTSSIVDNQYYFYTSDTREFSIVWNGEVLHRQFIPPKFSAFTIYNPSPIICEGRECSLQLIRTNRSTLPPLINAHEVYTVIHFPQSETNENDVVSVQNIKTTYRISKNSWQGDPCVPQQLMWEGLNCRITDKSTPPRITYLNLSSSGLTGTIADYIQNLTQLETLDLSNNNLTGEVPEFLGNMKSLVFINLSRNDLSGLIPQALLRKGLLDPQGNPRLCLSDSCIPPKSKPFPVAIVASLASVAIILVVLVLAFVLKKKTRSILGALQRPPSISSAVNVTNANPPVSPIQMNKKRFTYSEYPSHHKLMDYVDLLMRVHHTNLVNLVGYCNEGDHLALIHEYVPNGDLRHHLSGKGGRSIINWGIRLRIALEATSGLEYLHIGCIPAMVHRDVKTTNILLEEQFKARLADFGGESHVSTMIAGTPGYLDPEYYRTSRLTEKSDVYSFGIVLLEMITNQPVIDQSRKKSHITQWVEFELISGDIRTIMDPNLQGDYDSHSAWRVLDLAMSCANPSSTKRPSMSQVVVELKECLASENSRRNMKRGRMDSHGQAKVSMLIDTGIFPEARYLDLISKILKLGLLSKIIKVFFSCQNCKTMFFFQNREISFFPSKPKNCVFPPKPEITFPRQNRKLRFFAKTEKLRFSTETEKLWNMDSSLGLRLVTITLAFIHIGHAQDQKGFISLDCGLPANELSPYSETYTRLSFSSDENFIQSGKIGRIQANRESKFGKPYGTLRYFPNGTRNGYNLSVEKGRNHLIRAYFIYANYDGFDINPMFDLYLGPNLWDTIDLQGQVNGTRAEMLHIPISNSLQICLVKTGTTTPFISTLEIQPMGNDSYITDSGSLKLFFRGDILLLTPLPKPIFNVYDRVWDSYFRNEWTQISTTLQVNNSNNYSPPKAALTTAATSTNAYAPLTIKWNSSNVFSQYYLYTHFAEIQELQTNDTREFNLNWNGNHYYDLLVPPKFKVFTVFSESGGSCKGGECSFQLTRTNRSTLPPLVNALEVFTVIHFPQPETNETDVGAIKNIAATYALNRISWQGDPCVPQQFRWDGLNCNNTDMSMPPRITTLNLSSSGLTGTIAAAIQNLTLLQKLDLSNNKLTGVVPEFLAQMTSLVIINLRGNDLTGHVPQALQRNGLELLVEGNPRLCLSGSCTKDSKKKFPLIIVASVASVAIIVIVLVLVFVLKKKKPSSVEAAQLPPITPNIKSSIETKKRRFTYSEVMKMTNNFQTVVGEGGFGVVCHGTLNDSEQVAVKLLSQSSSQGYKHFKAEVVLLLRVHYTNLVNLAGYCDEGDHLALIYEFMPNGDLKQHLSGKRGESIFKWGSRLQIALEATLGLEYLHVGCTPPIVHRDIKTTNILLDQQLKAKIADFGLSRSFPVGGETHVSTVVAGTPGYLDPEYYHTSRLGEKSDVYSFGIVLLEMITNQPVIDQSRERSHIAQWVGFELNRGDITRIIDPNLHRDYESRSVWRVLELAMSCVNPSSLNRPNMSQVANELKECLASEKSRRNMNMDSQSSPEVSISFDTGMFPRAR
ncbi:hypothetical protein Bca52824_057216 [Brassica carinata]|uniref:Protein kinase domain-containing protein n=1 Tax=Brassica carinata TaxID=52824 RepID=A0A8X7QR25_BRACI|nr:hypothetical protein Bca52824_057216 [Brassica carinata]